MATVAGPNRAASILIVVGSTVDIEVCDVRDAAVVVRVKRSVRDGVGHLAGKWHVRLAASGDFGQWDLRLSGAFGRHVATFRSTPDDLADCVARRLRAFLRDVVPPLEVTRRPVLVVRRSHASNVHSFPHRGTSRAMRAVGAPAGAGSHARQPRVGPGAERGDGAPRAEAWGVRGGGAPRIGK